MVEVSMKWNYGVTSVKSRLENLLPRTLAFLHRGGFTTPRLFLDDLSLREALEAEDNFQLPVTSHYPRMRTVGNWMLAMVELYHRDPACDRYAIFQDDFVTYKNLKPYLERTLRDDKQYWNLYTFSTNESVIDGQGVGWVEAGLLGDGSIYHGKKQQSGRGAVALVFSRDGVMELLKAPHLVNKPQDTRFGWRRVDGGIVEAMNQAGYREMIHNPSLVQHTGTASSMGNRRHKQALTFRGEDFDALTLLEKRP